MKRQATLGKFFFTKRVKHRGSYVEEKIPDLVESGPPKHIQCDFCDSKFEKENGYSIHLKCKHAGQVYSSIFLSSSGNTSVSLELYWS